MIKIFINTTDRSQSTQKDINIEMKRESVNVFVTAWVDYCNMVLAGAPTSVTDRLQRALNAAARLVSGTCKYDRGLSQLLRVDLYRLDVVDPVRYN